MISWETQLLDIWKIHSRINLEILDSINEQDLEKRLDHYEITIGGQFAHIHRVRLLWLQREVDLDDGLHDIEKSQESKKEHIRKNLAASASRVEKMLTMGITRDGELSYFQPHLGAFVGYLIAHECMHHGEIGMILGKNGKELPLEVVWDWTHV
jgi:uncharacterized damage-inducible protein DinB